MNDNIKIILGVFFSALVGAILAIVGLFTYAYADSNFAYVDVENEQFFPSDDVHYFDGNNELPLSDIPYFINYDENFKRMSLASGKKVYVRFSSPVSSSGSLFLYTFSDNSSGPYVGVYHSGGSSFSGGSRIKTLFSVLHDNGHSYNLYVYERDLSSFSDITQLYLSTGKYGGLFLSDTQVDFSQVSTLSDVQEIFRSHYSGGSFSPSFDVCDMSSREVCILSPQEFVPVESATQSLATMEFHYRYNNAGYDSVSEEIKDTSGLLVWSGEIPLVSSGVGEVSRTRYFSALGVSAGNSYTLSVRLKKTDGTLSNLEYTRNFVLGEVGSVSSIFVPPQFPTSPTCTATDLVGKMQCLLDKIEWLVIPREEDLQLGAYLSQVKTAIKETTIFSLLYSFQDFLRELDEKTATLSLFSPQVAYADMPQFFQYEKVTQVPSNLASSLSVIRPVFVFLLWSMFISYVVYKIKML